MQLFQKLKKIPKQIIVSLENPNIPFINCFLTFLFAVSLRTFAESYSQTYNYFNLPMYYMTYNVIHYYLSYAALALMFICFFHFVTRVPIEKTARVVLPAFIVLLITPVLDIIVTKGQGANISYLAADSHVGMLESYLTYSSHFKGMSFGLRCEILFVLAGCFAYFRMKGISSFLSLFYAWFCYSLIFAWGSSPYCVQTVVQLFKFNYQHSSIIMVRFFLLEIFLLLMLLAYMANKKVMLKLLKNIFTFRFLHLEFALLLGSLIALSNSALPLFDQLHATDTILISIILSMISVLFVWIFAFLLNQLADLRITNKDDDYSAYMIFAYCSFGLAIIYAAMVNIHAFIIITMILGSSYIYAETPLRLKRIFIVSKMILAVNSLALIILGYLLVEGGVAFFPNWLFGVYIVGGTIALSLIKPNRERQAMTFYSLGILGLIGYLWISKILI